MKENKQDKPPATGNWLYGKIGSRFGWFPVEYVQPMTIESEVNFFYRLNVFFNYDLFVSFAVRIGDLHAFDSDEQQLRPSAPIQDQWSTL